MAIKYVDGKLGSDGNSGDDRGAGNAWKTIAFAAANVSAGDTIKVMGYADYNYEEIVDAYVAGTAGNKITIQLDEQSTFDYIINWCTANRSEDVAGHEWTESGSGTNEYYLADDAGTAVPTGLVNPDVYIFTSMTWGTDYFAGLNKRTEGTLGSLAAGEWAWGDNDALGFSTLYYRPAAGENISTVHLEVPYFRYSFDLGSGSDYITVKDIWTGGANDISSSLRLNQCDNVTVDNWKGQWDSDELIVIRGTTNCALNKCELKESASEGITVGSGLDNDDLTVKNSVIYDVLDNGIRVTAQTSTTNLLFYNLTIDNSAGDGIVIGDGAAITGVEIKNNTVSNSGASNFDLDAALTYTASNNNSYNGGSADLNFSQTDGLTVDPKYRDAGNNDYRRAADSALINAGVTIAGVDVDFAGNARPSPTGGDYDIGAYEAQYIEITSQPANTTKDQGQTATFSVTVTGDSPTYQWQEYDGSWADIGGETNSTYSKTNVQPDDSGKQYRCVITGFYNTVTSSAATLTVNQVANKKSGLTIGFTIKQ